MATTTILGLAALKRGLADEVGLVSGLPEFRHLRLADWNDFVVGGHEIRQVRLVDEAMQLAVASRALDPDLIAKCKDKLNRIDRRIRPGTIYKVGPAIGQFASPEVPRRESPGKRSSACRTTLPGSSITTGWRT